MTDHIRRLAVFVDEPDPGDFYWVIIENEDDASVWHDVESGEHVYHRWLDAWEAGCDHLCKMVRDPVQGPRTAGEDEDASPVG